MFSSQKWGILLKVAPYTFVRRRVPVRENTYPESSAYEVGRPVPFLAAFISPVLPPGTHSLLGGQWASIQSGHRVGLEPQTFPTGGMRSNQYATSLMEYFYRKQNKRVTNQKKFSKPKLWLVSFICLFLKRNNRGLLPHADSS